jgi:hypothetical protein
MLSQNGFGKASNSLMNGFPKAGKYCSIKTSAKIVYLSCFWKPIHVAFRDPLMVALADFGKTGRN